MHKYYIHEYHELTGLWITLLVLVLVLVLVYVCTYQVLCDAMHDYGVLIWMVSTTIEYYAISANVAKAGLFLQYVSISVDIIHIHIHRYT